MAKKSEKTLQKLRTDVQALSEAVWALKRHVKAEVAAESAVNDSRTRKSRKLARLEEQAATDGARGLVSAWGTWRLPGPTGERAVRWQVENAPADGLAPDDLDAAATRLAAIGHRQRLAIVLSLLEQPASVSELVASLELGTTGAAYHHLKALQGAGLVVQQERGVFEIAPEQIGFVIGTLSALATEATVEDIAAEPAVSPDGEVPVEA
jgi:DNA gyrase subunit B